MALPATAVIEVRTTGSDTQCAGGFNPARGATDYSQQNTAQATGTVTSSTTTVTATTGIFTSQMVGNYITDGTIVREITAFTSSTIVTVDAAPSWTGATIYVGGALASPGKAGAYHVAQNTIWIKAGTYTITSASTNVAGGCLSLTSGASGNATKAIGYNATRGDGGTKPVLQASGILTFIMVTLTAATWAENVAVDGAGLTSSRGLQCLAAGGFLYRCKALNCTNGGFRNTTGSPCLLCSATGCSTQAAFIIGPFYFCVGFSNTITGFSIQGAPAVGCVSLSNSGPSSDGFGWGAAPSDACINCVAYGNGRDGFRLGTTTGGAGALMQTCVSVNNAGFGFNANSAHTANLLLNCAGYNNTSGNIGTNLGGSNIGFVTLTGNPFTNAGSLDFSTNTTAGAGAALRAAGVPTATGLYALPDLATPSYPDIGAAQHADPAVFLPTESQVLLGVTFGTPTASLTGNVTQAPVGKVRAGETYGPSLSLTGIDVLPPEADVVLGEQYGTDGTEFTGSFAGGSCDYPAESNVRNTVVYDNGNLVGTYDPLAPSGTGVLDLFDDWRLIDSPTTISYYRNLQGGTYAAPFAVDYVQRAALTKQDTDDDPALLEINGTVFHIWRARMPDPQPLAATILDEVIDTNTGETCFVRSLSYCDWDASNQFQRIRLVCEVRNYDYRWTVTQKRPTNAQDTAGRPTYATYTNVVTARPCYLRTVDYSTGTALGRVTAPVRYELTIQAPAIDWRAKDVLAVTAPDESVTNYTIISSTPPTKFDARQRITLEKVL